jgi:DNA repair exonuclease SbcCD ATPase subunit
MEMNSLVILVIIVSILLIAILIYFINKSTKKNQFLTNKVSGLEKQYGGIINLDEEIENKKEAFEQTEVELQNQIADLRNSLTSLKEKYQKASDVYDDLSHQNNLLKDNLEIAEFGIYEPHFDYETSEIFKERIKDVRQEQKQLIKDGAAVLGGEGWTVNDSVQKGRVMTNKQKKLMLRAFNGECDSFISNVSWSNETRMEERIIKSAAAIDKMGETQGLTISSKYSSLKLKEMRLTHEYRLKKYYEKEEQRLIREQMREEEKAKRDFEKAQKEAKKEEDMLIKAMQKAQNEISKATEEERARFESQLAELQAQLKEAEEKNQRAISMAQQTKSGHVYVISNIGSFGENIYKIGMTRRLEPLDRVRELGDASVPFRFDVHAMIYSENAPELENNLHKAFEKNRLNYVNRRREYFNLSLDEIKKVVEENHGEIEFIFEPEAKEFRESLAIRENILSGKTEVLHEKEFPDVEVLFDEQ